jgi:DNA-binding NarL/FixJ family response regulator
MLSFSDGPVWRVSCLVGKAADGNLQEFLLSTIRILVADDDNDWRDQVGLLLQGRPEWEVICEVSDGSEAVQKAAELRPDLVLLEIGLLELNGIEAARRIRELAPHSKIVFLSLDNSLDVVQVALSTGAEGYVYKARAESDLLPAIDAVLRGEQFVTSMLRGYRFAAAPGTKGPRRHEVQFYSDDTVLLDSLARFINVALGAGDVAIAVITAPHRDGVVRRLKAQGLDVDAAIKEKRYIPVDAVYTLSTFMVNDMPHSARFFEVAGGLIKAAAKAGKTKHPRVAAFGEMVYLLWQERNADAAIRLEQLWNELATTYEIDVLCGYALSSFHDEKDQHVFQSICAEHSAVYLRENS